MGLIEQDQKITSAYSDESEKRCSWKIPSLRAVPCGGTHLKRTGETGAIDLKRKNLGRGKERIEIFLRPQPGGKWL